MAKRNKLEIIKDILKIVKENHNSIRPTPLLRKSNMSSERFKNYFQELIKKGFVIERTDERNKRIISITKKGHDFLTKYQNIINFIDEFGL